MPFAWLEKTNPSLLEMTLADHLSNSDSEAKQGRPTIEEHRAAGHLKIAEAWLALADLEDEYEAEKERTLLQVKADHQAELRDTAARVKAAAVAETLADEAAKKSKVASDSASEKNAAARKWVLQQWESNPDKGEGKAAFSRRIVHSLLLHQKFKCVVIAGTIERDWLPKTKK